MADTTHLAIPKPVDAHLVSDDVTVLQAAFDKIDLLLFNLTTALAGKANADHSHPMTAIDGLVTALNGKSDTGHTHTLEALSNVDAESAVNGMLLIKSGSGWVPITALSALGPHAHAITDITGLASQLVPTGTIVEYAGTTAPSGYLLCSGAAVSRTGQAGLFAIAGTKYGVGDTTTTFNLPTKSGFIIKT